MASPVDTSVKFYRNDFPGAPELNGVAGAAIGLLDACLVTGFGLRTATSVVVAGGVATVTLPSDAKNPNLLYSVVVVDGVTGGMTALNGEQRVTVASTTTLQFATAVADGTATGTITVKTAPAGWEKRFTGTNKAAYRSLSPESRGMHLWVNDAGTTTCNVRGFEAMSDVDSGTGLFPTSAASAGGHFWWKSAAANSNAARWGVFADHRTIFFLPQAGSASNSSHIHCPAHAFGDMLEYRSVDAHAVWLSAHTAAVGNSSHGSVLGYTPSSSNAVAARAQSGIGGPVTIYNWPVSLSSQANYSGADVVQGAYPPPDGRLRLMRILMNEIAPNTATTVLRGEVPGLWHVPQSGLWQHFAPGDIVSVDSGELSGRKLYCVYAGVGNADTLATSAGRAFVDITGPWR